MNLLVYGWLLLKASLFSTSGMGNVPILHDDLLPRGWATEQEFAEALAVGQVAPGPSGLWVISLGYLTRGLAGALMALLAITLPPLLILAWERVYRRVQHLGAVQGFVRGMGLAVVGIFVVVLLRLLHSVGLNWRSESIAAASLGLGATRRIPIIVILAAAAVAGILLS